MVFFLNKMEEGQMMKNLLILNLWLKKFLVLSMKHLHAINYFQSLRILMIFLFYPIWFLELIFKKDGNVKTCDDAFSEYLISFMNKTNRKYFL